MAPDARTTWHDRLTLSATRPAKKELFAADEASARVAGYLIGRLAQPALEWRRGVALVFDE